MVFIKKHEDEGKEHKLGGIKDKFQHSKANNMKTTRNRASKYQQRRKKTIAPIVIERPYTNKEVD
ncbi:MAG: hypothetical protein ACFC03_00480 [Candidatus Malihini olakiniferum]